MEFFENNKRGVLMDFILVFTVLLFCFIVIMLYFRAEDNLEASLISPNIVLDLTSQRINFEISEYHNIKEIYCDRLNSGPDEIKREFCKVFDSIGGVSFLLSNTQPKKGLDLRLDNLCESIYVFEVNHGNMEVLRTRLIKSAKLNAIEEDSKNSFSMELEFDLDKKYLLTRDDC